MAAPSLQETLLSNEETIPEELEDEANLTIYPSVNTRLANLRPSKDLLDYYRMKISQYDNEFEKLAGKLDTFKAGFEDQEKLNCEIRQREEEIVQLQKSLSDMQVYLFQEREQVKTNTFVDIDPHGSIALVMPKCYQIGNLMNLREV